MRFLNTKTLELEDVAGPAPAYAILSHRWETDEVTFQDFKNVEAAKEKRGWPKIENACAVAFKEGYRFIWIDTCCIDKSSSAELSEAINSMFNWYKWSDVCYAYLCDVHDDDPEAEWSTFRHSSWFTRGWTLQELIGPDKLVFLNKDWREIGTRLTLIRAIFETTAIPSEVFQERWRSGGLEAGLQTYSVACRMSWAANRHTTRLEDEAYCLMGLFDIHMPLIYGEGRKAFIRLQQKILQTTDDMSIFAWEGHEPDRESGLLSLYPKHFANCGDISLLHTLTSSFEISRSQVRFQTRVLIFDDEDRESAEDDVFQAITARDDYMDALPTIDLLDGVYVDMAMLNCVRPQGQIGLFLHTTKDGTSLRRRSRCFCVNLDKVASTSLNLTIPAFLDQQHKPKDPAVFHATREVRLFSHISRPYGYRHHLGEFMLEPPHQRSWSTGTTGPRWTATDPHFTRHASIGYIPRAKCSNYTLFSPGPYQYGWPSIFVRAKQENEVILVGCQVISGVKDWQSWIDQEKDNDLHSSWEISELRRRLSDVLDVVLKVRTGANDVRLVLYLEDRVTQTRKSV